MLILGGKTETGGIMITPLPGVTETEPGSATRPFFGILPQLVDDEGNVLEGNNVEGKSGNGKAMAKHNENCLWRSSKIF